MKLPGLKAPTYKFVGEQRQAAAGGDEREHHLVGQRRDKAVPSAGEIGGGTPFSYWKRRNDCQPAVFESRSLRCGQA